MRMRRRDWLVMLSPGLKSSKQSLLRLTHNANMLSEFTFNQPHWFAWNIDQIITASFPTIWWTVQPAHEFGEDSSFQTKEQSQICSDYWSSRLSFYVSFPDVSSPSHPCRTSQWCGFNADNGNKVAGCEKTSTCFNSTVFRSSPHVPNQNSLQGLWNQGAPTVQK